MLPEPLSPEKQAEIETLAHAIREVVDTEISELAANLATTDDAHLFGQNEFKIRCSPTRSPPRRSSSTWRKKKRLRRQFRDLPALRPSRRVPLAPHAHLPEPRGTHPLPPRLLPLSALRPRPVPLRSRAGLTTRDLTPALERVATLAGAVADSFEKTPNCWRRWPVCGSRSRPWSGPPKTPESVWPTPSRRARHRSSERLVLAQRL